MKRFFSLASIISLGATITLPSPSLLASDPNTVKVYGKGISLQPYLATHPDLVVANNITLPQDFVSVGKRRLKAKDYQGAIAEFSQALASNPNDIDALAGRSEAYYWLKDFPKAIADFDEAISLNPQYADAYRYRGDSYKALGEFEKAIADFQQQGDTENYQKTLSIIEKLE